jgi:two-component sensor histidine kinase
MRSQAAGPNAAAATAEPAPLFGRPSLRVFLLLILAIALSPVLVIGGVQWSNNVSRDNLRRQAMMRLVAEEAADRAEIVLSTAPALLNVIDALTTREDPCSPELNDLIDRFPQFSSLAVLDADGVAICSSVPEGRGSTLGGTREWFRELKEGGAPFVQSAAYYGPITRKWILASAKRRETADHQFNGALVIGVPVGELAFSLDRTGLPQDTEVALVDASGRVFGSRNWGAMLPPEAVQRLSSRDGAFLDVRTDQGAMRQAAIVPLQAGPMFAMLSAPQPTPFAFDNVSAFGNFALPLLAWFLALVTAWLATDRLVLRWLDYLRRVASLYAVGKLSVQPLRARQQAPTEITALADQLEDMAVRIKDRTVGLQNALEARDAALKEIHHRVKNNLQIINSLLSLQSRKLTDKAAIAVLDDARGRINALSLIHRSLYEQVDIRTVSTGSFLKELVLHLDSALGAEDLGIRVECEVDNDDIDADLAVPIALFTTEAVTNSIKHAFPNARPGRVKVEYRVRPDETVLSITDDGIGSPAPNASGLGVTLMAAFAKQAHGEIENETHANGGSTVRLRMRRAAPPAGPETAQN